MIIITCNVGTIIPDADLGVFFPQITHPQALQASIVSHQATEFLFKKIAGTKNKISDAVQHSSAFIAMEKNLFEFVKNSVENRANYIKVYIPEQVDKNKQINIRINSDGNRFNGEILGGNCIKKNYDELLENKIQLASQKKSADRIGGGGLGLAIPMAFLKKHEGKMIIEYDPLQGFTIHLTSHEAILPKNINYLYESFNSLRANMCLQASLNINTADTTRALRVIRLDSIEEEDALGVDTAPTLSPRAAQLGIKLKLDSNLRGKTFMSNNGHAEHVFTFNHLIKPVGLKPTAKHSFFFNADVTKPLAEFSSAENDLIVDRPEKTPKQCAHKAIELTTLFSIKKSPS